MCVYVYTGKRLTKKYQSTKNTFIFQKKKKNLFIQSFIDYHSKKKVCKKNLLNKQSFIDVNKNIYFSYFFIFLILIVSALFECFKTESRNICK